MRGEKQIKFTEKEVHSLFILIVILSITAITLMGVTIYLYFRSEDYKHEVTELYASIPQKTPENVNNLSAIPFTGVGEKGLKPLPPLPSKETIAASPSTPSEMVAKLESATPITNEIKKTPISTQSTSVSATPTVSRKELMSESATPVHEKVVKPVKEEKPPLKVFTKEEIYKTSSISYKLHIPIYRIHGTYTLDKIWKVTLDLSSYLVYPISEGVYRLYYIGGVSPPSNSERLLYVYSVQLISSTKKENIFGIAHRLRDKGFPVFVYDYYSGNANKTELYGIELGIFESSREAQDFSSRLTNAALSILKREVGSSVDSRYPKMIR